MEFSIKTAWTIPAPSIKIKPIHEYKIKEKKHGNNS